MTLIDVRCLEPDCGHLYPTMRPIADWPAVPPCEKCDSPHTEQAHLPKRTQWTVAPVIVFRAPDGTHRFPGEGDGTAARRYTKMGYTEVSIRNATEMRAFEGRMNRDEQAHASQVFERREQQREASESARRSGLRDEMQRMTPYGKDLARAALAQSDSVRRAAHQVGFHSEVYNVDRSNREDSRDEQGRRRRD